LPLYQLKEKEHKQQKQNKQKIIHSTVSTPLLKQTSDDDNISCTSTTTTGSATTLSSPQQQQHHYDLIPYTGVSYNLYFCKKVRKKCPQKFEKFVTD